MKLLPLLLLNLATAALAVAVYDQVKSDPEPASRTVEEGSADTAALEQRIRDLEAARSPGLTATGTDPRLLERVEALEASASVRAAGPDEPRDDPVLAGRASDQALAAPADAPPSPDEVRRFRRLRDAVARDDRMMKNAERVDRVLEKLSLSLSTRQRKRIHEAFTDFQPQVRHFWDEAKTQARETMKAGGTVDRGEIVEKTTAVIQDAFVDEIKDVVPTADAESIARTLLAGGK